MVVVLPSPSPGPTTAITWRGRPAAACNNVLRAALYACDAGLSGARMSTGRGSRRPRQRESFGTTASVGAPREAAIRSRSMMGSFNRSRISAKATPTISPTMPKKMPVVM